MHRAGLPTEQEHRYLCFGGKVAGEDGLAPSKLPGQSRRSLLIPQLPNGFGLGGFAPSIARFRRVGAVLIQHQADKWYPRQELHPHDDVRSVAS